MELYSFDTMNATEVVQMQLNGTDANLLEIDMIANVVVVDDVAIIVVVAIRCCCGCWHELGKREAIVDGGITADSCFHQLITAAEAVVSAGDWAIVLLFGLSAGVAAAIIDEAAIADSNGIVVVVSVVASSG